ncbi:MAG TPA: hypothetical protein VFP89_03970 [Propionibacteriaceae bacterium]|nr:hypothetical protein [Propionibacteriaceae bacterium]
MAGFTKRTVVTVAAGAMALGAGIGVAGLASADPTPSSSPSASATASPSTGTGSADARPGDGRGGPGGRHGAMEAELATQLAEKLGITETKVTAALQTVHEANRPTAAPTAGTERPDPAVRQAELAKDLAKELGIDEAKVTAALEEIQTARQAEHAAELKDDLDAAVKDGTLTQAEADAVTKAVQKGVIHVGGGHR